MLCTASFARSTQWHRWAAFECGWGPFMGEASPLSGRRGLHVRGQPSRRAALLPAACPGGV
jgi:hypothetical protein